MDWISAPVNRDPGISMRAPTAANAPQIAISPTGNGVVVWQEPEINGVARIWARRMFGASLDYVLPVSATSFAGSPIVTKPKLPAWRSRCSARRRSPTVRRPARVAAAGAAHLPEHAPRRRIGKRSGVPGRDVADSAVPGGAAAKVGPPSIDIDEQPRNAPAVRRQRRRRAWSRATTRASRARCRWARRSPAPKNRRRAS